MSMINYCLAELSMKIVNSGPGSLTMRLIFYCVLLDLKRLYWQAGVENKPTVFLFNDTQVVEEIFLEDINNVLSSGEVPNLYKPDEFEEVCMRRHFIH